MQPRKPNEENQPPESDFVRKSNDLDFDPWGVEEDDAPPRRRDPLRRPTGEPPEEEIDIE